MNDPYQILGIDHSADDGSIKQAFFDLLTEAVEPDKLAQLQQAYRQIKDAESRMHYELFSFPEVSFAYCIDQAFRIENQLSPESINVKQLLKSGLDKSDLYQYLLD